MEITIRTIQSRFLLRPSEALNQIIAGVLAKALEHHPVKIHAVVYLSTHAHILLSPASVKQLAGFMRFLNHSLSIEVGKLHDWPGTMWSRRYTSIPVSEEPEAQIGRLKYLLANSCKEGLVLSPYDWPGLHSATALVEGQPIRGIWIDRTAFHNARKRDPNISMADFEEETEFHLDPLPCWRHLDEDSWRSEVADLVTQIEMETLAMHRRNGTVQKGATAVRRVHPHERPASETRSPKPLFHALAQQVRHRMREAYSTFVAAYVDASERLRRGSKSPGFPPNCFPPALPFVPPLAENEFGFT